MYKNEEDIVKALEAGEDVSFYGWFPIEKSDGATVEGPRRFKGIASTKSLDLQDENVHTDGLDFSYFVKNGYFNDDHKPGPEHKIGEPTKAELRKDGLYIEGFLYKNHKKADAYWELMNALDKSDSMRKVGLSIEGKVKRRNGNQIYSAWIKDVAITCAPVNTDTFVEVMKALSAFNKSQNESGSCGCGKESCICKALNTSGTAGAAPEASNEDPTEVAKALPFDEAINWLASSQGVPLKVAEVVAKYAFKKLGDNNGG